MKANQGLRLALFGSLLLAVGFALSAVQASQTKKQAPSQPKKPTSGRSMPVAIDPELANQVTKKQVSSSTGVDGPKTSAHGDQCHVNDCKRPGCTSGYDQCCATCSDLRVFMPLGARVVAVRCYTTANYPDDRPLTLVPCGQDIAWSFFQWPSQTSTPTNTVVSTTYYNRSHNRDRTIKLEVDYVP